MVLQITCRLSPVLRPFRYLKRGGWQASRTSPAYCAVHFSKEASMIATTSACRLTCRAAKTAPNLASSKPVASAAPSDNRVRRGVGGGPLHPDSVDPFKPQPRRRMDLKLGPYAGGRLFVSPREDPKEFILCVIVVTIFLYTLIHIYTQPGGETINQRRRRIIRERLMKEAGITQADLDELEADESPLSAQVESPLST
ncbi:hypothetical protein Esti_002392 [Eimeria stiedai]